jgi:hypothetical protein
MLEKILILLFVKYLQVGLSIVSGTIIRGTLIQGLNRPQKCKTQLSNRAHSAYRLVRLYSHTGLRLPFFLQSEGEEGLLDSDSGEE